MEGVERKDSSLKFTGETFHVKETFSEIFTCVHVPCMLLYDEGVILFVVTDWRKVNISGRNGEK